MRLQLQAPSAAQLARWRKPHGRPPREESTNSRSSGQVEKRGGYLNSSWVMASKTCSAHQVRMSACSLQQRFSQAWGSKARVGALVLGGHVMRLRRETKTVNVRAARGCRATAMAPSAHCTVCGPSSRGSSTMTKGLLWAVTCRGGTAFVSQHLVCPTVLAESLGATAPVALLVLGVFTEAPPSSTRRWRQRSIAAAMLPSGRTRAETVMYKVSNTGGPLLPCFPS